MSRDARCPFCGSAEFVQPVAKRTARRIAASVVLVGGVSATVACFGAYGGPPPRDPSDEPAAASTDGDAAVDGGVR